jgi:steroid 5-alpha reductase family enzyme
MGAWPFPFIGRDNADIMMILNRSKEEPSLSKRNHYGLCIPSNGKREAMEEIFHILIINLSVGILLMVMGWLVSLVYRNVTLVDSLWGLGFPLMAWVTFFLSDGFMGRKALIAFLVTLWGLRLAIYLSWRNWGKGEDPRYQKMRRKAGPKFRIKSFYSIFMLQAALMWVISLSLQYGLIAPEPAKFTPWDGIGTLLWCLGFGFQALGDWQLTAFKADPANQGRVMDQGLWAYSRHPNYFGESLMWWGIFFIVLAVPHGEWTIISPLTITYLLLNVSGIPLTERVIQKSRPGYESYIRKTSAFIPWFPKK